MGNFDKKNVCIKIGVRENLTDPRFVEFMEKEKHWDLHQPDRHIQRCRTGSSPLSRSTRTASLCLTVVVVTNRCGVSSRRRKCRFTPGGSVTPGGADAEEKAQIRCGHRE